MRVNQHNLKEKLKEKIERRFPDGVFCPHGYLRSMYCQQCVNEYQSKLNNQLKTLRKYTPTTGNNHENNSN